MCLQPAWQPSCSSDQPAQHFAGLPPLLKHQRGLQAPHWKQVLLWEVETQEERLQGTEGRHVHCWVCRGMSLWGALYFCSSCCDGEVFRQSRLVFYLLCKISAEFSTFPATLVNVDIYSFLLVPHVSSWTPAPALPCETLQKFKQGLCAFSSSCPTHPAWTTEEVEDIQTGSFSLQVPSRGFGRCWTPAARLTFVLGSGQPSCEWRGHGHRKPNAFPPAEMMPFCSVANSY